MNKIIYGFFLQMVILCLCYSSETTFFQDDTTKKIPDYRAADVVIETEWSGPEKISNVDVFIGYENKVPVKLELVGPNSRCEIRIISGMAAKIIDTKTGKILAQIRGPEQPGK